MYGKTVRTGKCQMTKLNAYRIAASAAGLLAGYLLFLWMSGDFLRDSDCPEFTQEEAAIAEAITLVRGKEKGEWSGGLILEVIYVRDRDECGGLRILGGGAIQIKSDIEISGAFSDTVSLEILKYPPDSSLPYTLNASIGWVTGFRDNWTAGKSGREHIDRNRLSPFLERGVLKIRMWREEKSELDLYIVRDSGIVAVRHNDRFWGDRGVRDRVFLTVAGLNGAATGDTTGL